MTPASRSPRPVAAHRPPESYLASVSDLMVGLLFVFILLLMALALDVRPSGPSLAVAARDSALVEIAKGLQARGVVVRVDLQNGILRLPEELLFDKGHAEFRPGADRALRGIASELMYMLPHCPLLEAVVVEGHTDDRPIRGLLTDAVGTYRDNWDLSYHRAKQTYHGLVAAAPALGRLGNDRGQPVLGMGAFGPARPVADNGTAAGRLLNRRIDLRIVVAAPVPVTPTVSPAP